MNLRTDLVMEAHIRRQDPSREIVGWDDPLSDKGAWIVPAESEALAPLVWINWYRKRHLTGHPNADKEVRKTEYLKQLFDTDFTDCTDLKRKTGRGT